MLQKKALNISLAQGLDNKTDPKQVVVGKMVTLENATMPQVNQYTKRNGNAQLGSSITSGNSLGTFQDELIADNGQSFYSYSEEQNSFNSKGQKIALDLSVSTVVRNIYNQLNQDSDYNNNLLCYVYTSNGTANYSIYDKQTGSAIVLDAVLEAASSAPKVRAIGSHFVLFYKVGTDLKYKAINVATPSSISGATTLDSSISGSYDVCLFTKLYVAASKGTSIDIFSLDSSLVQSGITNSGAITTILNNIAIFPDSATSKLVIAFQSFTNFQYMVYNTSFAQTLAPTTIDNAVTEINCTGIGTNGSALIYYEVVSTDLNSENQYIKVANVTLAGVITSTATLIKSVGLASKVFQYNSNNYFVATHQSKLQNAYYIVNASATSPGQTIVGRIAYQNGGGLQNLTSQVNQISNGVYEFAYLFKDILTTINATAYTQTGVNSAIITFGENIQNVEIGNNLHMTGAILSMYDGSSVVEHSYNLYPEDVVVSQLSLAGALQKTGSYNYSQTYEWMDNQGQTHRSAPSVGQNLLIANTVVLNGYLTSGSAQVQARNITASHGFFTLPNNLRIGMTVTGTGVPANTTIASFTRATSPQVQYFINLSNNATATGLESLTFTDVDLAVTVESNPSGTPTSKVIELVAPSTFDMQIYVDDQDSTKIYTNSNALFVGQTFFSQSHTSQTYTVTAVNGTQAIVSPAFTEMITVCTFNNAPQAKNFIFPGMTLTLTSPPAGWPASVVIQSISGNLLTVDTTVPYTADPTTGIRTTVNGTIANTYGADIKMPTLRLTDKSNVSLQVYRTQNQGTNYQRVTSVLSPIINDKTIDYEYYADGLADSVLAGNDLLYTNGGVLDNIAPPATSFITEYQSRLLAVPSETPNQFWYSQQVIPGDPVEWNDSLVWNVDNRGGSITAMHQMDSNLIIFKKNTIFYMNGQGPSPNGSNNDFTNTLLISTDSGCIDSKSLVIMPMGLMYKSLKGIYLLDRSLGVNYIGSEVEAYNSNTITSAQVNENLNQVRFTLDNGKILVYDYFVKQWYVFAHITAVDSVNFQNYFTYIDVSGNIFQESASLYTDNGNFIPVKFQTGWLSLAGIQGYQRLYDFIILMDNNYTGVLNVSFAYDYDSTIVQTVQVTPNAKFEYRCFPQRQRCTAIQVTIEEIQSTNINQVIKISSLALEVGVKAPLNKLPASQSYG